MDAENNAAAAPAKSPEPIEEVAKESPVAEASEEANTGAILFHRPHSEAVRPGTFPFPPRQAHN